MCQVAYRVDTGLRVDSMGDIRALVGAGNIAWNDFGEESREAAEALPDSNCLCWVNLASTLVWAGYRVWANPEMIPEILFDALPDRDDVQVEMGRERV